jgi:hypothetical protein
MRLPMMPLQEFLAATKEADMLIFRISVPGQLVYQGIFKSPTAAQDDAAKRFPNAHPASVICLTWLRQGRTA